MYDSGPADPSRVNAPRALLFTLTACILALVLRFSYTSPLLWQFSSDLYNNAPPSERFAGLTHFGWVMLAAGLAPGLLVVGLRKYAALPSLRSLKIGVGVLWLVLACLKLTLYPTHYLSSDEYAYNFQAELIASGKLSATPPVVPEAFTTAAIYCSPERWTTSYQPGWPAALALAYALRVQPLAGCLIWLLLAATVYALAKLLWGEREARASLFLFALCANFWLLAWAEFPHLWTGWLTLFGWYSFLRGGRWNVAAVLAWTLIFNSRLQDIPVAMMAPLCWSFSRSWPSVARKWAVLGLGAFFSLALCGLLNYGQTGDARVLPYALYHGSQYGLHSWDGLGVGLYNLAFYAARVAWWSPPLLLPLGVAAVFSGPDRRKTGLLAAIAVQILFYIPFPSNAMVEWGSRFYVISILSVCLLGGREWAAHFQQEKRWGLSLALAVCLICNLQTLALCYRSQIGGRDLGSDLEARLAATPSLLFVRQLPPGWGRETLLHDHPDLRSPVVVLWLDAESNEALIKSLPALQPLILDMPGQSELHVLPYSENKDLPDGRSFYLAGINYYLAVRDLPKAVECFRQSLKFQENAKTWALVGQLEADLGRNVDARRSLERALELDPGLEVARVRRDQLPLR